MALKIGEIYGELGLRDAGFNGGMDKAEGRWHSFGSTLLHSAVTYAAAGGAALGATSLAAFNHATQLEAMANKASTVFGAELNMVEGWAQANANAMGLTKREATGLAANFADLLVPMGFSRDAAADMSTRVVGLSGALAQWSGGTRSAAEVSDILNKAIMGEKEGLKELGISITEDEVSQRLLLEGKGKLMGAALAQAKAEATTALIFEKSKDAQNAYEAGGSKLIKAKMELKAKAKELWDELSVRLIPVFTQLATWATGKIGPAFDWLSTTVIPALTGALSGESGGLGGALTGLMGFMGVVRDIFVMAWPAIKGVVQEFIDFLSSPEGQGLLTAALDLVTTAAQAVYTVFTTLWPTIRDRVLPLITNLLEALAPLIATLLEDLAPVVQTVFDLFKQWWEIMGPAIGPAMELVALALNVMLTPLQLIKDAVEWLADSWLFSGVPELKAGATEEEIVRYYKDMSALGAYSDLPGTSVTPVPAAVGAARHAHASGGFIWGREDAVFGESGPELLLPLSQPERSAQLVKEAGYGMDLGPLLSEFRSLRRDFQTMESVRRADLRDFALRGVPAVG